MAAASSASSATPRAASAARWAAAWAGPCSSSRCTMPSTFIATRVWNWTRPSVALMTSRSRNSRTASTSWAAVGTSCGSLIPCSFVSCDQPQEAPLVLAAPPADSGQLHRPHGARQVGERLSDAHHAPLQRAQDLPPADDVGVDGPARRLGIGREQVVVVAEPADGTVDTESPRLHTQPPEILHWVAEMRQLPIEDGAQTIRADDEVAVAEVAVNDRRRCALRSALVEPTQCELERRMRLAEPVEHAAPHGDGVGLEGEAVYIVDRDRMDAGQRRTTLGGEQRTSAGIRLIAQDLARDR